MQAKTVFLALGANLGDRRRNIEQALAALAAAPGVQVVRVSELRETAPEPAVVAGIAQPPYLNGVAELAVQLPALALFAICQQLESAAGRDRDAPRNTPRPLDLDVLSYGDETIDTRQLRVPHPRMFDREFVMQPLGELTDVTRLQRPPSPSVVRVPNEFADRCSAWLRGGCTIGLVPTMGALHDGHAALVRAARNECDRVAVTIFVNPLQFAPTEDLDRYPRTFEADLEMLRALDVDLVFAPDPTAMYCEGFASRIHVGVEATTMEGAMRPTHFEGVTTVVAKLFILARPTRAYFGQKDAQQVAVVRRMVDDLAFPLELRVCPIVRESDGLAKSSRNRNLDAADRAAATVLFRALAAARDAYRGGEHDAARLLAIARACIDVEPKAHLDYLELRSDPGLAPLPVGPVRTARMLVAVVLGGVRLIDNMSLSGVD